MNEQKTTITFEQDGEKAVITITTDGNKGANVVWEWDPALTPDTKENLMHHLAIDYIAMLKGVK